MIHAGRKSLGCRVRGSHPVSSSYERISYPQTEGEVSPTPALYNSQNYVNRLGTWNVRGINDTTKREEVVDIFKKLRFELLALTETKLKGEGESSWC